MSLKNPVTPPGFDPETARLVAQRPNHYATPGPRQLVIKKKEGKAVPLQAYSDPEDSRKFRFPDFMTTAQDGGKVVSLIHRPPLPPGIFLVLISVRG